MQSPAASNVSAPVVSFIEQTVGVEVLNVLAPVPLPPFVIPAAGTATAGGVEVNETEVPVVGALNAKVPWEAFAIVIVTEFETEGA
jgi:hypothetical protein